MLTVEVNDKEERVEVYLDKDGMQILLHSLEVLRANGGHDHLMTPDWAGNELTNQAQGAGTRLFHHLLITFHQTA